MEHDRAIVLRLTEYSESSQIATLYARRAGKLRLIAKGVKRSTKTRFAVGLDLLEVGNILYTPPRGDAKLGTLADWRQTSLHIDLRSSLKSLQVATYIVEALSALTEDDDPHPDLFDETLQALQSLCAAHDPFVVLVGYQRRLLKILGFAPQFDSCVRCNRKRDESRAGRFVFAVGGLVCRQCIRANDRSVLVSAALLNGRDDPALSQDWFQILDGYITFIVERPLRAAAALLAAKTQA